MTSHHSLLSGFDKDLVDIMAINNPFFASFKSLAQRTLRDVMNKLQCDQFESMYNDSVAGEAHLSDAVNVINARFKERRYSTQNSDTTLSELIVHDLTGRPIEDIVAHGSGILVDYNLYLLVARLINDFSCGGIYKNNAVIQELASVAHTLDLPESKRCMFLYSLINNAPAISATDTVKRKKNQNVKRMDHLISKILTMLHLKMLRVESISFDHAAQASFVIGDRVCPLHDIISDGLRGNYLQANIARGILIFAVTWNIRVGPIGVRAYLRSAPDPHCLQVVKDISDVILSGMCPVHSTALILARQCADYSREREYQVVNHRNVSMHEHAVGFANIVTSFASIGWVYGLRLTPADIEYSIDSSAEWEVAGNLCTAMGKPDCVNLSRAAAVLRSGENSVRETDSTRFLSRMVKALIIYTATTASDGVMSTFRCRSRLALLATPRFRLDYRRDITRNIISRDSAMALPTSVWCEEVYNFLDVLYSNGAEPGTVLDTVIRTIDTAGKKTLSLTGRHDGTIVNCSKISQAPAKLRSAITLLIRMGFMGSSGDFDCTTLNGSEDGFEYDEPLTVEQTVDSRLTVINSYSLELYPQLPAVPVVSTPSVDHELLHKLIITMQNEGSDDSVVNVAEPLFYIYHKLENTYSTTLAHVSVYGAKRSWPDPAVATLIGSSARLERSARLDGTAPHHHQAYQDCLYAGVMAIVTSAKMSLYPWPTKGFRLRHIKRMAVIIEKYRGKHGYDMLIEFTLQLQQYLSITHNQAIALVVCASARSTCGLHCYRSRQQAQHNKRSTAVDPRRASTSVTAPCRASHTTMPCGKFKARRLQRQADRKIKRRDNTPLLRRIPVATPARHRRSLVGRSPSVRSDPIALLTVLAADHIPYRKQAYAVMRLLLTSFGYGGCSARLQIHSRVSLRRRMRQVP